MALPKKKSRPTVVNNQEFRYIVSTSRSEEKGDYSLNLTVQDNDGEGSILKVQGIITMDFWLDFPQKNSQEDYPVLTPKDISSIITKGIKMGWNPKENGKPYIIKLDNSFITKYIIK